MASEAQNTIAPECPRNDRKTHGDGFGIPISVVFRDFETFFNKFLENFRSMRLSEDAFLGFWI